MLFEETVAVPAGEQRRLERDVSRGATQVQIAVDLLDTGEETYRESAPGSVPRYRIVVGQEGIDVTWTEE